MAHHIGIRPTSVKRFSFFAGKPQNLGVTLTTQTTGSFRSFWSSCRSATHPPANPFLGRREYQPVTASDLDVLQSGWWLDADFLRTCIGFVSGGCSAYFSEADFRPRHSGPVEGAEYITGFRGCSRPPQFEDCGRINGLVLLSLISCIAGFRNNQWVRPSCNFALCQPAQCCVIGNISTLPAFVMLNTGQASPFLSIKSPGSKLSFALISASYRRNRSGFFHW